MSMDTQGYTLDLTNPTPPQPDQTSRISNDRHFKLMPVANTMGLSTQFKGTIHQYSAFKETIGHMHAWK